MRKGDVVALLDPISLLVDWGEVRLLGVVAATTLAYGKITASLCTSLLTAAL